MINTNPNLPGPQTPVQQSDNPDLYMGMAGGQAAGPAASSASDWSPSAPGVASTALLTPDALMAYCQSRLQSIDGQVQTIFAQQQNSEKLINDIDTVVGNLNNNPGGFNTTGGDNGAQGVADYNARLTDLKNLLTEAGGPSTQTGAQIQNAINTFTTNTQGGTDNIVSATDMTSVVKDLQTASTDANSGAELSMINLQSLMSERQTAVQLSTNLVQSLGQEMNAVASNIGK